jgi:hypothetical protein
MCVARVDHGRHQVDWQEDVWGLANRKWTNDETRVEGSQRQREQYVRISLMSLKAQGTCSNYDLPAGTWLQAVRTLGNMRDAD